VHAVVCLGVFCITSFIDILLVSILPKITLCHDKKAIKDLFELIDLINSPWVKIFSFLSNLISFRIKIRFDLGLLLVKIRTICTPLFINGKLSLYFVCKLALIKKLLIDYQLSPFKYFVFLNFLPGLFLFLDTLCLLNLFCVQCQLLDWHRCFCCKLWDN
jgi:hypothetical protein